MIALLAQNVHAVSEYHEWSGGSDSHGSDSLFGSLFGLICLVALAFECYQRDRRREIDRLTEERDEARRLYCKQMAEISRQQDVTEKWWAEEMGWDCFREDSSGK